MKVDLSDFATFIAVARHKSFRAAGAEIGLSPSAVSHAIKQLENRLKLRLFNRTTRSVALTEAGQNLFDRLRPAFDDIRNILDDANCFRDSPMGTLKINAPRLIARITLLPLVTAFSRQYPDIQIEIVTDDLLTDIVSQGYDAGIRLHSRVEKDMIAVPIGGPVRLAVVATPEYFAQHGKPEHPRDLVNHQCVVFRYPSKRHYLWDFTTPEGPLEIATRGKILLDDMDVQLDAVLDGAGIGYLYMEQVKPWLENGKLVSVLGEYLPERPPFMLYYPNRQFMPFGLRAFVDFIKAVRQRG
ncbi:LysR family transcriptional regulator [Salmonella enterica subsp. enterica serovar Choleraesuis]|nr:LysR family transcriptional regulator [Salmonella enterica subsp. enterica serovar Choleraesuis]